MDTKTKSAILLSVLAAATLLFAPTLASEPGVTWHVRPDGSNDSCSGLVNAADPGIGTVPRACAFRTPQKGANAAGGGDTVLLHAGTYSTAGATVQGNTSILGINQRTDLDSESTRLTIKAAGDSLGEFRASPGTGVSVGSEPAAVASGDFNRDGKPDLAVANASSDSVTILLGTGGGSFSAAASSPVAAGNSPAAVATADFNADNKADLAIANSISNDVTVLLGNGAGGFSAAAGSPVSVGGTLASIATGDLNQDGKADLVVSSRASGAVTVLLGNGSGGFAKAAGSPVTVGTTPRAVAIADFDNDAAADVAVANTASNDVTILLGNGAGGLAPAPGSPVAVGTGPRSIAAGDFNLDGTGDLAVANSSSDDVTILLGDGAGGFAAAPGSPVAAGSRPWAIVSRDFSVDGKPDLAVVDSGSNEVTILLGNEAGRFTRAIGSPVSTGTNPQSIASADFDLDGKPDLAVPNAGTGDVTVLLGYGNVVFDGGNTISTGVTIWGTCFVTIEGITFRRFTANTTAGLPFAATAVVIGSPGVDYPASFNILKSLTVTESSLLNFSGPHAEIAIWCATCSNNTIAGSRIESTQPVAIAVGSDRSSPVDQGGAILDNWIVHARDNHPWIGVYALRTSIWTMDGNYLEEGSLPDGSTDLVQVNESAKWTFTNNVFFRPPASAINLVDDLSGGDLVEQHRLLNNTIECTGTIGTGVRCDMCSASQVRNNIIAGCLSGVALVSACLNSQLGYNDFFSNSRNYDLTGLGYGYTLVGNDIFDDPKFQALTPRPNPYYLLLESSPAINAGDDARCGTVPLDGNCDMGAYQAVSTLDNDPPYQPAIVSVGQVTGRSAVLRGTAFSDPDTGDSQKASQWQVDEASGDFTSPVYDSGRTTADLLSIKAGGLAASTDYQARVRYQDVGGLWSPWSDPSLAPAQFTTLEETAIPPKVTSVDPAQGAKGVSVSVAPVLVFNVPLEPASVSTSTVKLKRGDTVVTQAAGSPALCTCGEIVTITAAGLLNPNTEYKIVVKGDSSGIQSRDGSVPGKAFSSTFTTETALAGSDPTGGATGVPTTVTPTLSFKWALDPARVNDVTFMLKDTTVGREVSLSSVILGPDGTTVTLTPTVALKPKHEYRIKVLSGSGGLLFTDGRRLGADIKVKFKTAAT